MKEFSPLEFADKLIEIHAQELAELHNGLEKVAKHIERVAKDEFGIYQPAVGPFPPWEELADSTKLDRLNQGYDPDEPLLRTGKLRDSISHRTEGLEATIGSTSQVMVYHEFGTSKMPPRPVLGPAVYRSKEQIMEIVAKAAMAGLASGQVPAVIGYDDELFHNDDKNA